MRLFLAAAVCPEVVRRQNQLYEQHPLHTHTRTHTLTNIQKQYFLSQKSSLTWFLSGRFKHSQL